MELLNNAISQAVIYPVDHCMVGKVYVSCNVHKTVNIPKIISNNVKIKMMSDDEDIKTM